MNESYSSPAPQAPKKNNTVIIVVVVAVILCCCCIAVLAIGYQYGDQILQQFGLSAY